MANGKCDQCGALTSNTGNMFQCGSSKIDYHSTEKKTVQTTTSIVQNRHCVLCDNCINEYVEKLKKGKGNYAAPIIIMILTAIVGGLFSLMGGVIRVICIIGVAAYWVFAVRNILKIRKEALAESEKAKATDPLIAKMVYEREAEMAFLKRFNTSVTPIYTVGNFNIR